MKNFLVGVCFVAGCVVGEDFGDETLSAVIQPEAVGDVPDCGEMGGVPAGAEPFRIAGASEDLRAYGLGEDRVLCVGLVDLQMETVIAEEKATESHVVSVADGRSTTQQADELQHESHADTPAPPCDVCGKDPEPMGPGPDSPPDPAE